MYPMHHLIPTNVQRISLDPGYVQRARKLAPENNPPRNVEKNFSPS